MPQLVKGTAYIARRALLESMHGTEQAASMIAATAADVPFFQKPVLATTMMPLSEWLAWNDSLVGRYFAAQPNPYFWLGEKSAEWALTAGPYRNMLVDRGFEEFIARGPALYRTYYEIGTAAFDHTPGRLRSRIEDIPSPYRHPHFEHAPHGYSKGVLVVLGANDLHARQIAGFSRGHSYSEYIFTFTEPPPK